MGQIWRTLGPVKYPKGHETNIAQCRAELCASQWGGVVPDMCTAHVALRPESNSWGMCSALSILREFPKRRHDSRHRKRRFCIGNAVERSKLVASRTAMGHTGGEGDGRQMGARIAHVAWAEHNASNGGVHDMRPAELDTALTCRCTDGSH